MTTEKFELPYLDHGFIRLVDHMGSDTAIVEAAKLSYSSNKIKKKEIDSEDMIKLLRYLLRHRHTSPFEMAEVKFHLKLPIFVMRQLVRHRTANINELSARYSKLPDEFYVPEWDYLAPQSKMNKQGRAGNLSYEDKEDIIESIEEAYGASSSAYHSMLKEQDDNHPGLSRELARIVLPVGVYTECFWKIDLNNLLKFLSLRMDPHAQREIVDLADGIYEITKEFFPETIKAYDDYIRNSITLSNSEKNLLGTLISSLGINLFETFEKGKNISPISYSKYFTEREYNEFLEKLKRLQQEKNENK